MTFVNSKHEVKTLPLSTPMDNLEQIDKSLFKRLQYAKEILVQMMSVSSMPESLQLMSLPSAAAAGDTVTKRRTMSQVDLMTSPRAFGETRQ